MVHVFMSYNLDDIVAIDKPIICPVCGGTDNETVALLDYVENRDLSVEASRQLLANALSALVGDEREAADCLCVVRDALARRLSHLDDQPEE
jgi:hypothetical protein